MRDRSKEFDLAVSNKASQGRIPVPDEQSSRLTLLETETSRFVKDFLCKVEEIYKMFLTIDKKIRDVSDVHTALLEKSATDENLFSFYEEIKKRFVKISQKITDLENSFDVTKFFGSDTELRICSTQLLTLKKKLTGSVSDYYNIQEEYKEKCKARMKRRAEIIGADTSRVDFDAAIESKTEFFLHAIFPDYNVAHHYLNEIKKRHEEFLRLEKSILQLRDLIFDLNMILTADAALINRIDKHAKSVDDYVQEGVKSTKVVKRKRKSRKLIHYVCFFCIALVATMIIMALITTFA